MLTILFFSYIAYFIYLRYSLLKQTLGQCETIKSCFKRQNIEIINIDSLIEDWRHTFSKNVLYCRCNNLYLSFADLNLPTPPPPSSMGRTGRGVRRDEVESRGGRRVLETTISSCLFAKFNICLEGNRYVTVSSLPISRQQHFLFCFYIQSFH